MLIKMKFIERFDETIYFSPIAGSAGGNPQILPTDTLSSKATLTVSRRRWQGDGIEILEKTTVTTGSWEKVEYDPPKFIPNYELPLPPLKRQNVLERPDS